MKSILTVCVGNICRSPVAAALFRQHLSDHVVASAGIGAMVGHNVDPTARAVAEAAGVCVGDHAARQFSREIGEQYQLILVLEASHRRHIEQVAPELSGRIMRLSHWNGNSDIPDPYLRGREFHTYVHTLIQEATMAWVLRLRPANLE